ncbi:helix-turn-helix domain-containing protein [Enterobacter sp. 118C5]|uniref:helix-turn-helix domain-containing protein n=1 Tax=Enterobacter TaxID=547 RepID=UPI002A8290B3|nr:helix-turn-helix domain-containing protein [Enterobacter sp. 118C5]
MKPVNHFHNLIAGISDASRIKTARARQLISLDNHAEPMTFILHDGIAAAYRNSDQLLLKYFKAPMILGVNELVDINADTFVKAYTTIHYEIMPSKNVLEVINHESLWKDISYVYMYGIKQLLHAHKTSAGLSTYELIRLNLMALMSEDEDLRSQINVSDYIQEKTRISRSRVMKILSDLRNGGYIEVNRGILITINKLPERY